MEELQVKVGDAVIIQGDKRKRVLWNFRIVEKLLPEKDRVVRAVQLSAKKLYLEREVQHLYPLKPKFNRKDCPLSVGERSHKADSTSHSKRKQLSLAIS